MTDSDTNPPMVAAGGQPAPGVFPPVLDFILHRQVPSMNQRERMRWWAQRREVRTWELLIRAAIPVPPILNIKLSVRIHAFRTRRCSDEANLIGGCKGLIDGLVRAGLLVDDSREWATFLYAEDVASLSPTKKPATRIIITPAEQPATQEPQP